MPRRRAATRRRSTATFVVGLILLSISFATYWVVGLVGFVIMLVSAVTLVQSVRRLAREHWGHPLGGQEAGSGTEPLSGRGPGVGGQKAVGGGVGAAPGRMTRAQGNPERP